MRVSIVVLWRWLDEVMHKVGARHRQEGQECQDGTERTETTSFSACLSPPVPVANVMALVLSSIDADEPSRCALRERHMPTRSAYCGRAYLVAFSALCSV